MFKLKQDDINIKDNINNKRILLFDMSYKRFVGKDEQRSNYKRFRV